MLLQTNSYVVPREKRVAHTKLLRRFRQEMLRLGCESFEVYEQVGNDWNLAQSTGRFVQLMRFRDRRHQQEVQQAERSDPMAQKLIAEFCELINFPCQQQQGYFATSFYNGLLTHELGQALDAPHPDHEAETGLEAAASAPVESPGQSDDDGIVEASSEIIEGQTKPALSTSQRWDLNGLDAEDNALNLSEALGAISSDENVAVGNQPAPADFADVEIPASELSADHAVHEELSPGSREQVDQDESHEPVIPEIEGRPRRLIESLEDRSIHAEEEPAAEPLPPGDDGFDALLDELDEEAPKSERRPTSR